MPGASYPFAKVIEARELLELGMTRLEIADHLGVSRNTISRWCDPGIDHRCRTKNRERERKRRRAQLRREFVADVLELRARGLSYDNISHALEVLGRRKLTSAGVRSLVEANRAR